MKRRTLLATSPALCAWIAGVPAYLPHARATDEPRFALGVASGEPTPNGLVLWTRLMGPGLPSDEPVPVQWEVAEDEAFTRIAARGTELADAAWAHSVHAEPSGLQAGRSYWYRFTALGQRSPIGRTRTAPAPDAGAKLRLIIASCQRFDMGYYSAWRHAAAWQPDLILFLGDYIYETATPATGRVRRHAGGYVQSLAQYRARYAQYKGDPDLQAAHACAPWMPIWDDHEVDNDYAGLQGQRLQADFANQRRSAYQAYWEHMPLPRSAKPRGADAALYASVALGPLATVHMLDTRQHRSPQACPKSPRKGGTRVYTDECPEWDDPARSMLGDAQERWLDRRLRGSGARWDLMAQGMVFTLVDEDPGPRVLHWNDSWAGYPAARRRLVDSVAGSGVRNPLMLGGDIHAFIAADQRRRAYDGSSPVVMSELVTTSISSGPPPKRVMEAYRGAGQDVPFADGEHRGYLWLEVTPKRLEARLQGYASVREEDGPAERTLFACGLEDGDRGLKAL